MRLCRRNDIKIKPILAVTAIVFLFSIYGTTSAVASTIYVIDRTIGSGVSVTGYIETNGQIGLLSNNDIIDWNFLFNGSQVLENRSGDTSEAGSFEGRLVKLEPSVFGFSSGSVSATETGLFFDFSSPSPFTFKNLGVRSTLSAAERTCPGGDIQDPREWSLSVRPDLEGRSLMFESVQTGGCPQPNVPNPPFDGITNHSGVIQFASSQPLTNPIPESPRICRRLNSLRGFSNEDKQKIFPGSPGTGGPHGF